MEWPTRDTESAREVPLVEWLFAHTDDDEAAADRPDVLRVCGAEP
jgi:hypothetical protein